MSAGFIYVLVNSAMPGLVKVGKTTRLPSERSAELSGVTGIATPFIVAFEQYFENCDAAEQSVHERLTRSGLREASNREFFRAAPNDVIRIVMEVLGSIDTKAPPESSSHTPPWKGILEEAEKFHYGAEDVFEDRDEARKLYLMAARLGAPNAYRSIAESYDSLLENRNVDAAIKYYREAAKTDFSCYAELASLFEEKDDGPNAYKAWNLFLKGKMSNPIEDYPNYCADHIRFCLDRGLTDDLNFYSGLTNIQRYEIIQAVDMLNRLPEGGAVKYVSMRHTPQFKEAVSRAMAWSKQFLSDDIDLDYWRYRNADEPDKRGWLLKLFGRGGASDGREERYLPKKSVDYDNYEVIVGSSWNELVAIFVWAEWSPVSIATMKLIEQDAKNLTGGAWYISDYSTLAYFVRPFKIRRLPSVLVLKDGVPHAPNDVLDDFLSECEIRGAAAAKARFVAKLYEPAEYRR